MQLKGAEITSLLSLSFSTTTLIIRHGLYVIPICSTYSTMKILQVNAFKCKFPDFNLGGSLAHLQRRIVTARAAHDGCRNPQLHLLPRVLEIL